MYSRLIASCMLVAAIFFSASVLAAPKKKKQISLKELRERISVENQKIEKISLAKFKVRKALSNSQKKLSLLENQDKALREKLETLIDEWRIVSKRIFEIEDELDSLKERAYERLRVLYMTKPSSLQTTALAAEKIDDFPRYSYLLSKIHSYDASMVKRFSALYTRQREEEERYEVLIREQKKVKQRLERQQLDLQAQVKHYRALKGKLDSKQKETEKILTKLRTHALRLETVLTSITDGKSYVGSLYQGEKERRKKFKPKEKLVTQDAYEGPGLKRSKGSLSTPVNGKVVRRFGKYRHKEFKDIVYSKGVLYSALAGSDVRSIARGRVMYFGRLPGYGTLVIVDHGLRSYSLYARLDNVRVVVGEIVDKNDIVGTTGQPDEDKANFYFEIRKNGKPVNPQAYYTKKL